MTERDDRAAALQAAYSHYEEFKTHVEKLGDVARQLSFAGVAAVWLFKGQQGPLLLLPRLLACAAVCFIGTLALDLMRGSLNALLANVLGDYLISPLSQKNTIRVALIRFMLEGRVGRRIFWTEVGLLSVGYFLLLAHLVRNLILV